MSLTICLLSNLEQCKSEKNILSNIPKPKDLDFGIWDSAITELRRRRGDFKVGNKRTLEEGSDYSAQPPDNPNPELGGGGGIKLKLNEPAEGRIQVKPIKGGINRNLKEQHPQGNPIQKPIDSLNPKEHAEGKIEVKPMEDDLADSLLWRGRPQQGQKPDSELHYGPLTLNEEKERKKKAFQKTREHRKLREERHKKRENRKREEIERKKKAFEKRREHREERKERKENREQRKHSNRAGSGSGQQQWMSDSVARSMPIFYDDMEDSTPANTEKDGGRKPQQNRKMSGLVHHGSAQWEHKGGISFTYSTSNTETRVINNKPVVVRTETKIGNNVKNVTTYWDDERGKPADVLVIIFANSFTFLFSPGKSCKEWSSFN